jgi:hypothetical protein
MADSNENAEHLRAGIGARLARRDAKRTKTARSVRETVMAGTAGAEIDGLLAGASKAAFDVGDGATVSRLTTEVSLLGRTGIVAGRSFGMG